MAGFEKEVESLVAVTKAGTNSPKSNPMIVFLGNWKYYEDRLNCDDNSTGSKYLCSSYHTNRGLRGARIEFLRKRAGITEVLDEVPAWTSTTLLSGGFLIPTVSIDYLSTDQFQVKIWLKYVGNSTLVWDRYWGVAGVEGFGAATSGWVSGVNMGSYIKVDFFSNTVASPLANIYASIAEGWDVWSDVEDYESFLYDFPLNVFHYDSADGDDCPCPGTACYGSHMIQLCTTDNSETWRMPHTHLHELGHDVQTAGFLPDLLQGYYAYPYDDITLEGTHSWTSAEWEEAAFMEGWANFAASAVMYGPNASAPKFMSYPINGTIGGIGPLCAAGNSFEPNRKEGNVAAFLWDLFDSVSTNDSYADALNLSVIELVGALSEFYKNCLYNHCAGEADLGYQLADDGPNVYDMKYHMVANGYLATSIQYIVANNCLTASHTN